MVWAPYCVHWGPNKTISSGPGSTPTPAPSSHELRSFIVCGIGPRPYPRRAQPSGSCKSHRSIATQKNPAALKLAASFRPSGHQFAGWSYTCLLEICLATPRGHKAPSDRSLKIAPAVVGANAAAAAAAAVAAQGFRASSSHPSAWESAHRIFGDTDPEIRFKCSSLTGSSPAGCPTERARRGCLDHTVFLEGRTRAPCSCVSALSEPCEHGRVIGR